MTDLIQVELSVPYRERIRTPGRTFVERTGFARVAFTLPLAAPGEAKACWPSAEFESFRSGDRLARPILRRTGPRKAT